MTLLTLICLYFRLVTSLFFVRNPLILGMWVILLALLVALFISIIINAWFGILIFLIYVGGLIVIFSYFTALVPNQQINLRQIIKIVLISLVQFIILIGPIYFYQPFSLTPSSPLSTLYANEHLPFLFYFALLLFFTLIAVVKVSSQDSGPLRPFKFYV